MASFEQHGIKHLSASSLGLWRENPGLWSLKYLGGFKDDAGPSAWRGSAVEGGMLRLLHNRPFEEAVETALATFDGNCMGEVSEQIDAERALIEQMLRVCNSVPRNKSPLIASQVKVECWLDDVEVPLIGYIDFLFEDGSLIDLKTTKACPSSAKPAHSRQVSIYMHSRKSDNGSLLYVTGKKFASYSVTTDEKDAGLAELRRDALSLQRFLSKFEKSRSVIDALPMNSDDFRWSQSATEYLLKLDAA